MKLPVYAIKVKDRPFHGMTRVDFGFFAPTNNWEHPWIFTEIEEEVIEEPSSYNAEEWPSSTSYTQEGKKQIDTYRNWITEIYQDADEVPSLKPYVQDGLKLNIKK